jgi:formylglycine-generating enzyme required for sulfatase activity
VLAAALGACGEGGSPDAAAALDALFRVALVPPGGVAVPPGEASLEGRIERPFVIDRFEVTNGEYAEFLAATGHADSAGGPPRDGLGRLAPPPGREDHPVAWVSRPDAEAFAAWRGMRLPTALEWERAARGRFGYRYPWGNDWFRLRANTLELELFDTTRVGTFESGRSPDGCYDMEGNVWEWTAEPEGLLKGGSFWSRRERKEEPWVVRELRLDPGVRAVTIGFRCAADAEAYLERTLPLAAGAGSVERAPLRKIAARWGPDAAPVLRALAERPGFPSSLLEEMAGAAEAGRPR